MNFTCDNCQKRYSIADEKVRGKTVKVRCKNCQNVISVEGPAEEESTRVVSLADVERIRAQERSLAGGGAAAAPAPAPVAAPAATAPAPLARPPAAAAQTPWDDEPTRTAPPRQTAGAPWFVMVRNKQEGPLDEAAVADWMAAGTISARSFFWRQGMPDWKRGSDIPELAALFAPAAPAEPPPEPPPVAAVAAPRAPPPARREPEPPPQAFYAEPEPGPSAADSEPEERDGDEDEADSTLYGDPRHSPVPAPAPSPRRGHVEASPAATGAPLNELFSDLDLPGNRGEAGDDEDARLDETRDDDRDQQEQEDEAVEDAKAARKRPVVAPRRSPLKMVALVLLLLIVLPVVALGVLGAMNMLPPPLAELVDKAMGKAPPRVAPVAAPPAGGSVPPSAPPTGTEAAPAEGTPPPAGKATGGEPTAPAEGNTP
ncbi:DUF4339 domain-containing protein [Corallococcus sp. ZKHCc1 1396]|uniref:DUF4339 domain-containing protein n=2 Tax=Corallococcus soli TaxID=2710757 RepID=A0ABR9PPZ3_9BACT|nr:GYF domain-containing protein [Corallococcus soli]MBE4749902.1 DUF4339 domain-containing protein [Corallococcus soli]